MRLIAGLDLIQNCNSLDFENFDALNSIPKSFFYRPNRDMGIGPRTSSIKGSHGLIAWNLLTDIC